MLNSQKHGIRLYISLIYKGAMLGGQVCYLPNYQECKLQQKAYLLIGQVTNLPSQHQPPSITQQEYNRTFGNYIPDVVKNPSPMKLEIHPRCSQKSIPDAVGKTSRYYFQLSPNGVWQFMADYGNSPRIVIALSHYTSTTYSHTWQYGNSFSKN